MKFPQSLLLPNVSVIFGVIAIVLVLNGIAVHRNGVALHETHSLVVHTHAVLSQAEQIFASLVDAESAVRGYAITGDDAYLDTYRNDIRSLPEDLKALRNNVADNPTQLVTVQAIDNEMTIKLEHLRLVMKTRSEEGINKALIAVESGDGKDVMDRIREEIKSLKSAEKKLLWERIGDADRQLFTILFANVVGVCLGLAICGIAWLLIDRQMTNSREAEIKANAERENLLVTLTSIGNAVVVTDSRGHIQLLNPVAIQLLGDADRLVGHPLWEVMTVVNQSSREPVKNPVISVLETETVVGLPDHSLLFRSDGTEVQIEASAAPIFNRTGRISGVVFVFRDCSDRWRFEKELLKRERRFRKMFETPLLGIAVASSEGRSLLEANDAYLDLIGYDRGELSESSLGWGGVDDGKSPLDSAAQLELRETGVCRPFEKVYTRSDGTVVPVLISSTKLFDDEDRVIVFVTDLTRSKRVEAALRESENRFQILSESMPQMVWMAMPDGRFDYVNNTMVEYSGRTFEELTGRGWTELLHVDDRQKLIDGWKFALTTGQPFELEHRLRQFSGDYRWYLTRARPMHDAAHQITRWVGTSTDINDHKQVETLLKEEHQRKDQFLALLAHELRNPLAPLANAVQVFGAVRHDPIRSGELIAIMQRQIKQMTRLIDDLLDIARITQDRIPLRRERIAVSVVIAAAVEAVQPWIKDRSHRLTISVPDQPLWIDADAARLSQVLTNLLQNAAKYTDPGGQIAISAERADKEIFFRVRDNGAGLSGPMLTRIFDLFMQVEHTLNRAQGGLGIGLTLVRALVELHGGRVTAHSAGLGLGSEFVVRLPLIDAPPPATPDSTNSLTEDPAKFSRMNVLVVDDVQASAKTLGLMLTVLGSKVETAFDGPSALAKIDLGTFDIVFLDIAMPGMDGLEVARRLRSQTKTNGLWMVALTGFGQEGDRQRSLEAGFNEHIIKPASMAGLSDVLQRVAKSKDDESSLKAQMGRQFQ